jgi:sporulation protein YlmC with PRC-barrel domain
MNATDGDIGKVADFLLDDERWTIRYMVAGTGGLLDGRWVLISPISFIKAEWSTGRFHLALTKNKINDSPNIDLDRPVSRQHEREYYRYYGYPYYWGYGGLWGLAAYPGVLAAGKWFETASEHSKAPADSFHLRSAQEVRGYHIQGNDGAIVGHVEDFIVDDETWEVRYLVIDTSNWWFGKKVLVSPQWASRISWEERKVYVDMPRQAVKDSPQWDPTAAVNREYETRLYDYYGRPAYWDGVDQGPAKASPAVQPTTPAV